MRIDLLVINVINVIKVSLTNTFIAENQIYAILVIKKTFSIVKSVTSGGWDYKNKISIVINAKYA